jgi:signal transduction histidine kinase
MKRHSLARRLITLVLLIELGAAVGVSVTAFLYERHMHLRAFDVLLQGHAESLLGAVQDAEDPGDNVMLDGSQLRFPREDLYLVQDATGRVVGQSSNWPGVDALRSSRRGHDGSRDSRNLDRHPEGDPGHGHSEPAPEQKQAYFRTAIHGEDYRVVSIEGVRIVDPGDKNGGTRRYLTIFYGSPTHRVWNAIYQAVEFYAGISLIVLLLTGILMAWLLNRSLSPLRGLAAAAGKVSAASWSFGPPESARQTEELEPLVHALELLLKGLQISFEKQKRFVGDAAHELKTGVAVVKSSLQLLDMKPRSQQEYQAGLARCLADCQRIEELVAKMLTLAKMEELEQSSEAYGASLLFQAIEDVVVELDTMAQTKHVSLALQGASSLISSSDTTTIDPEQFKLLISNLLLNAVQHSPENSTIRIEATFVPQGLQVEIRDQGDGIAPEDLPTIFDRFSRGDPSRSRNTGGTGLGLAICKAIVDRFHGTIQIVSEPSAGTSVVVRFPLLNSK